MVQVDPGGVYACLRFFPTDAGAVYLYHGPCEAGGSGIRWFLPLGSSGHRPTQTDMPAAVSAAADGHKELGSSLDGP